MMQPECRSGFTLIELSIVLVIIGLITGGVLIGRDLIKAAEIRATVGQIEKYNAAANTFRSKYNGLPGDIANAANFGFSATNQMNGAANTGGCSCTVGMGDNNGLVESAYNPAYPGDVVNGEVNLFWTHLSQANLISALSDPVTDYGAQPTPGPDSTNPSAKIGKRNMIFAASANGLNYFAISDWAAFIPVSALTPLEAFQIDSKLDDGMPDTGLVISMENVVASAGNLGGGAANNSACYNTATTPPTYSIATAQTDQCTLSIRSNF